jgi:hypothetical protein
MSLKSPDEPFFFKYALVDQHGNRIKNSKGAFTYKSGQEINRDGKFRDALGKLIGEDGIRIYENGKRVKNPNSPDGWSHGVFETQTTIMTNVQGEIDEWDFFLCNLEYH